VLPDVGLEQVLADQQIDIVILAVPAEVAQGVADRVVRAGVRAILNFAPVKLRVPDSVALRNVDMVLELEGLSFALVNR
jgi:redox-sensing transcriptional repressor